MSESWRIYADYKELSQRLIALLREIESVLVKREEGESDYLVKMIREALK